ncbi:cell division protein [Phenylobacterium hankyongense]|uniref:Cell division protein n=1 Tax=Phenylobacterium hankyongense TaxID=1813876 RepID=A0A328B1A5_9CAUL|nr:cell division protein [Phenylobacterium hankyongense]RAK60587.1 cell division protein [Phenylobacterium hankyongense]
MSLLSRRVRGFRLVDLMALGFLVALILGVYLAKTIAGRERSEIARVESQIGAEKARIRLLQAEVSHLEQPARIEHLSETYLGLAPVSLKREASPDALPELARQAAPAAHAAAAVAAAQIDPTAAPAAPTPAAPPVAEPVR